MQSLIVTLVILRQLNFIVILELTGRKPDFTKQSVAFVSFSLSLANFPLGSTVSLNTIQDSLTVCQVLDI